MGASLTESERMAINEFLAEHWADFLRVAENHLDDDEIERLEDKLEGKR